MDGKQDRNGRESEKGGGVDREERRGGDDTPGGNKERETCKGVEV